MTRLASIALAAVGGLVLAPATARAAPNHGVAQTTGSAQVQLIAPGTVIAVDYLRFGNIARPTGLAALLFSFFGGTVTIAPNGTVSSFLADTTIAQTSGGRGPGSFLIKGTAGQAFTTTLPASIQLNGHAGAQPMTVNAFADSANGAGKLDATGKYTLYVGATLNLNPAQATGSYQGSYTITVTYQ